MRLTYLAIASALAAGTALGSAPVASMASDSTASAICEERLLADPLKAKEVVKATGDASDLTASERREVLAVAQENMEPGVAIAQEAVADTTLWLDTCAKPFYVEPTNSADAHADHAHASETPSTAAIRAEDGAPYALADTFKLNSKPGATKTVYLNFVGGPVNDTAWNNEYGPLSVEPYNREGTTAFSSAELTTVQQTYLAVAEDYAPFDVNVTTQAPAAGVITKESTSDKTYGVTAYITQNSPIGRKCGCGGLAYVGITDPNGSGTGLKKYSPAWVFADGVGYGWSNMAEAASHEIGHNLGLNHDGLGSENYYDGSNPWAPLMGVGYGQPLTQWSKGEYAGATEKQDDLAIIARTFATRADDHGNATAATLTTLPNSAASASARTRGLIERTGDEDAFEFTASSSTTITVKSPTLKSNLDVSATVVDAAGTVVATSAPTAYAVRSSEAAGLDASFKFNLPATSARYKLVVRGAGQGDPAGTGYSNYGSLGAYEIVLTTATDSGTTPPPTTEPPTTKPPTTKPPTPPTVAPVVVLDKTFTGLKVSKAFSAKLAVRGGTGTYTWAATGLPAGLRMSANGVISGKPLKAGRFAARVRATSGGKTGYATAGFIISNKLSSSTKSKLPKSKVKKRYSASVRFAGGEGGYVWSKSGKLPKGLALKLPAANSSSVATLKGKAAKAGTYRFKVAVQDRAGDKLVRSFTIVVKK